MVIVNIPNVIATGTVMSTNLTSKAIPLFQLYGYAIQTVFTGTPTGTFYLQGSCDPQNEVVPSGIFSVTNWTTIINSSVSVSTSGNLMWNVQEIFYNYVRLAYTDTSGGTSTAVITVSSFNGKGEQL